MPIPDKLAFHNFLSSLELTHQNGAGYMSEVAIPESEAEDRSATIVEKECRIWFKPVEDFTLESILGRIQQELQIAGHKSQRNIALTLLCFFCLHPQRRASPVGSLNELMSHVVEGDLSQFFIAITPPPANFRDFSFGSFTLGKLNTQRLGYRSDKAGSDYFRRWEETLIGRFAIEREVCRVKVFDWSLMMTRHRASLFVNSQSKGLWDRFVQTYFHFVSVSYFEEFWQQFIEQQEIQVAIGAPFMGDRELRLLPSSSVSIYMNINEGRGFVAPHGARFLTMNFGGVDEAVPETLERLRTEFDFDPQNGGELHQAIKIYARFLTRAKRHLIDDRPAEAYLHFVIALDLLFGDKDGLTRNIASRVAVIVYQRMGMSFNDAVKTISKIYDARSKYVHRGVTTGMTNTKTVQSICEEVLCCILRLQKGSSELKSNVLQEWLASLDYFAAACEAGRGATESDLIANGIAIR
jgi:Apea-like HEPN